MNVPEDILKAVLGSWPPAAGVDECPHVGRGTWGVGRFALSFSVLEMEAPGPESSLSFPVLRFGHSDCFSAR